mmetsp:Transcript_60761/g.142142  ORF Transcript_60761/g.142142 Transcript_60761/m.142142 type:complete len:807 (+) Transcript_60761:61-2481(+)
MKLSFIAAILGLAILADASKLYHEIQQVESEDARSAEEEASEETGGAEEAHGEEEMETLRVGTDDAQISSLLEGLSVEEQEEFEHAKLEAMDQAQELARQSRLMALQQMEDYIFEEAGEDGILVIGTLEKRNPCDGVGYLHTTFVHMDHKEATFVCLPCSPLCKSSCGGPGREGCDEVVTKERRAGRRPVTLIQEPHNKPFADGFHNAFVQISMNGGTIPKYNNSINISTKTPEEVKACLEKGTCSMETKNTTTASGDLAFKNTTATLISMTPDMSHNVDKKKLNADVQNAIDKEKTRNGLIAGVDEDIDKDIKEIPEWDDEVEDGPVRSDSLGKAETPNNAILLQEFDNMTDFYRIETQEESYMNKSRGFDIWGFNQVMQGKWKDYARFTAKMAAKDFAKEAIKAWIGTHEGKCVDAIDELLGVVTRVHHCYAQATAFRAPICAVKNNYITVRDTVQTIYHASGGITRVAGYFTNVPYVGAFMNLLKNTFKLLHDSTRKPRDKIYDMKKSPYGDAEQYENWDCCRPKFLMKKDMKAECTVWPGDEYRCAACNKGAICNAYRACNKFYITEMVIDDWAKLFVLPVMGAAALFVQGEGFLKGCVGTDGCNDIKKATAKMKSMVEKAVGWCPVNVDLNFPVPNVFSGLQNVMNSVNSFLNKVAAALDKQHCLWVPLIACETRWHCWNWCISCPGWGRRRRWSGFRWRSCCFRTCIPYPYCWTYWRHYCFSARDILNGISGFLRTFLSPILKAIEWAIELLMRPVRHILNGLVDALMKPLNAIKLNLPDITLPEFSVPSCQMVKDLKNR